MGGAKVTGQTFNNLDFMRSVAVLLVASTHLLIYLGYKQQDGWLGITGVCIFFVHTSLVLMWSLERDSNVARFYLRRAFRIYPLWLVVLAIYIVFRFPTSPNYTATFEFFMPGKRELLANIFLVFNLVFGARVVGASWSLPLEVQMYLFLPCLFYFAKNLRAIWPLLTLDLFIMAHNYFSYGRVDSSLPMCVPYFLPGIITFVLMKRPHLRKLPSWLFPICLLILVAIDRKYGNFRHSWVFCLMLGLGIPLFRDMTNKPISIASHYIAKYSYGVYLTHLIAIGVSVHLLRDYSLGIRILAFIATFVLLPIVLYHTVEEPLIRLGARLAKKIGSGPVTPVTEQTLELEMVP